MVSYCLNVHDTCTKNTAPFAVKHFKFYMHTYHSKLVNRKGFFWECPMRSKLVKDANSFVKRLMNPGSMNSVTGKHVQLNPTRTASAKYQQFNPKHSQHTTFSY